MINPEKVWNLKGQLWLNVGAGSYALPGFVHLDNSLFVQLLPLYALMSPFLTTHQRSGFERYANASSRATYLVHDCGKPLPFPEDSVDHILASHFLERLYKADAERVLRDFFKVLKPRASLHVIVPNLTPLAKR